MAGGITFGSGGGSGGVTVGNIWVPTESGLSQSGGFLDRLQGALDARAQYQGELSGLAPALRASGVPIQAPKGFLSQFLDGIGLGGQQPQPQAPMPVATSSTTDRTGAPAPTMGGAGPQGQPTSASPTAAPGGMPTGDAIIPAIAQLAQKHGLDPLTTIRAVRAESGANPGAVGDNGSSFGLLQLHYGGMAPGGNAGAGMGDDFTRQTGLDARDPANAMAALDYALGRVAKEGWGAFHGAAKAGIGQWDGVGGAPSQMAAYAPSGSDSSALRPPTPAGQPGANPMPIATSGPAAQQSPQSAMPRGPVSGAPDAQASAGGTSPGQVLAPLMANPATRGAGAQAWGMLRQAAANGGAQGGLTLPAGMTPEALATMISTPQTEKLGLSLWERALYPQITSVEPGRAIFRGTQYLGQAPSAPMDVGPGHSIVNPNSGGTIAAVPPDLQHAEVGRDAYGQPQYGAFNPRGGAVTPFQGGQGQGGAAPAVDANGQPLTGDAFLKTLPPALGGQVKAIAEGRLKLPTGMGAGNPMAQRMRAAVLQYDPSFDQAGVDARFETRKDFASGDAAKTMTAGGTAVQHLNDLAQLIDKLGNADTSIPGNNWYNAAKNRTADTSAAGANLAAFNTIAGKYTEEATKFYRGTGGTEADIKRDLLNVDPNMSPTQLRAAIGAQLPLLKGKIQALQDRWHASMGAGAQDFPIVSPATQAAMDSINSIVAPRGAPSANLPVAAPAGGGDAPRAGGATRTLRGVTYTQGPDGHWYMGQ